MTTRAIWPACLFGIMGQPATARDNHSLAAVYSQKGGRTASGQLFSPAKLTAAHRSLPFGTFVRVTNLKNRRTVIVRINDRGPFNKGRLINDLKSAWLGMKACMPAFRRAGGGAVVNTSSILGIVASGKATAYSAAKGGVLMVSKAAAVEYARDNIRANCIHPGFIDTPMTATLPADFKKRVIESTPMGQAASPDEVARAALFLVSEEASFITGAQLVVDGGFTAV